ncbi:MAG: trigger factor [Dehalococcoidia bacterium]
MKVTSEKIENSQIELNIEMDAEEQSKYEQKAYNHLVGKVKVPGFRKGKTPKDILERHIGKDAFLEETLELLIPEVYEKALEEQNIDPVGRPDIQLVQREPIILKAIVPVKPEVKLGDYKSIRLEKKQTEIKEEDVTNTLESLRNQQATLLPVDHPAEMGDVITIDVEGESDGQAFPPAQDYVYELSSESQIMFPGFTEKLVGMKKGDHSEFTLSYPEDHENANIAGKTFSFSVTAKEIKEKQLPELDDEFAKASGSDDLESLKNKISENLTTRSEEMNRMEFEQNVVDTVVEQSEVIYPPVLVENEINRMLEEEARRFKDGVKGMEEYLATLNKTMEEHRDELKPTAEIRVIRSLVLTEIAEKEEIKVEDGEIDEEIENMVKDAGEQTEDMRTFFNYPQTRRSIEQYLIGRKTIDRLVQIAGGQSESE